MRPQLSLFKNPPRARSSPEFNLHVMVADILRRWATPGWRWTHLPFGEHRSARTGGRLKRMGAQRGWPDFILLSPVIDAPGIWCGRAHFLELKRKGSKLTVEQRDLAEWCQYNGYPYAVADSFNVAVDQLKQWGAVRASVSA